eukprot:gnl/TRDRNA2_/TRDRNA2_161770_c0_seq1.p1 gnl/TRDRNA2_/TRDRNA2_161770_c0~~gnl/TRDRNA2_/TRDRNA2_161770_c0_seq1.p1  ORF type:complete len:223 (+),score=12.14 gnl/TRDRNA2_/TRDRNA2_161770_c0_seq1:72-740(+)
MQFAVLSHFVLVFAILTLAARVSLAMRPKNGMLAVIEVQNNWPKSIQRTVCEKVGLTSSGSKHFVTLSRMEHQKGEAWETVPIPKWSQSSTNDPAKAHLTINCKRSSIGTDELAIRMTVEGVQKSLIDMDWSKASSQADITSDEVSFRLGMPSNSDADINAIEGLFHCVGYYFNVLVSSTSIIISAEENGHLAEGRPKFEWAGPNMKYYKYEWPLSTNKIGF